jgi:hypothetical protein
LTTTARPSGACSIPRPEAQTGLLARPGGRILTLARDRARGDISGGGQAMTGRPATERGTQRETSPAAGPRERGNLFPNAIDCPILRGTGGGAPLPGGCEAWAGEGSGERGWEGATRDGSHSPRTMDGVIRSASSDVSSRWT